MAREAKPRPEGFHSATPYICVEGAAKAIEFYKKAFGARELMRHTDADGRIRHAQILIGDSVFMMSDAYPEFSLMKSVQAMGGSPLSIFLHVDDADAVAAKAVEAGATEVHKIQDQEYGRSGGYKDPFGLIWWITAP